MDDHIILGCHNAIAMSNVYISVFLLMLNIKWNIEDYWTKYGSDPQLDHFSQKVYVLPHRFQINFQQSNRKARRTQKMKTKRTRTTTKRKNHNRLRRSNIWFGRFHSICLALQKIYGVNISIYFTLGCLISFTTIFTCHFTIKLMEMYSYIADANCFWLWVLSSSSPRQFSWSFLLIFCLAKLLSTEFDLYFVSKIFYREELVYGVMVYALVPMVSKSSFSHCDIYATVS